jgi:hypothetical protein
MEVENPEVKEIKLAEEKNGTMKGRILDSLKIKWVYFRNKIMSLVACTTNTGVNNNNVNINKEEPKEKEVVEDATRVPEEQEQQQPQEHQEVVEETVSEPSPEVTAAADDALPLPVATPVVVEEPITLNERI